MIDLSGHTAGNALPALARRVAPVQLSWLGYFATTGVQAVDAVLMDTWHVPEGLDAQFTEEVVRLPYSRFCYQPVAFAPPVAPLPARQNGYITFGSFNNTAKYNDAVFKTWALVLQRVPDSRLILKWSSFADESYGQAVRLVFALEGIAASRIELRPASVHRELLEQYADIDIALDPYPFSGGHTTCEALWMGVPVITLPGRRPVSRQSCGFIANLGVPQWHKDWIAHDEAGYVNKAHTLATDLQALQAIRQRLRETLSGSKLMDAAGFAKEWTHAIHTLVGRR